MSDQMFYLLLKREELRCPWKGVSFPSWTDRRYACHVPARGFLSTLRPRPAIRAGLSLSLIGPEERENATESLQGLS